MNVSAVGKIHNEKLIATRGLQALCYNEGLSRPRADTARAAAHSNQG